MAFAKIRPVPAANAMNAVIYARYSSEKQTENSIDFQLRAAHAYCEAKGFTVIGEYIDRAISGTSDNRPEFQRMITDSKRQTFAFVIVYRYDRFARNRYDSAIYKKQLELNGVRVLSTEESIGIGDEGLILESIYEAMAESYSRRLSKIVTQGMKETAMKGNSTGGNLSYGLKVVDHKIALDEGAIPAIQYCFESRASGIPKKKIADELNTRGYRTKTGKLFQISTVAKMITNPVYKGVHNYCGIERACPAAISVDLWDRANEIEAKEKKKFGAKNTKVIYALSGKLFCGKCGTALMGDSGSGCSGTQYTYYTCSKRKRAHSCDKKSEKKDFIEWYICEQTQLLLTDENIKIISENVYKAAQANSTVKKQIASLKKDIASIDAELDAAADALIKTNSATMITRINEKAEQLDRRKAALEKELAEISRNVDKQLSIPEIEVYLSSFKKGDLLDEEYRLRLINTFINCVYLYDDKVVIYYNANKMKEVSYIEMLADIDEHCNTLPSDCSDSFVFGEPREKLSEQSGVFYKRGGFGVFVFLQRDKAPEQIKICERGPPIR